MSKFTDNEIDIVGGVFMISLGFLLGYCYLEKKVRVLEADLERHKHHAYLSGLYATKILYAVNKDIDMLKGELNEVSETKYCDLINETKRKIEFEELMTADLDAEYKKLKRKAF